MLLAIFESPHLSTLAHFICADLVRKMGCPLDFQLVGVSMRSFAKYAERAQEPSPKRSRSSGGSRQEVQECATDLASSRTNQWEAQGQRSQISSDESRVACDHYDDGLMEDFGSLADFFCDGGESTETTTRCCQTWTKRKRKRKKIY
jgi:hypothetical protein